MPIPLALGAALISGGASLLGNAVNAFSQNQANKQSMKIARYQNAWNLEQWNRENAYNLPTAQMARLKAAGLNPNLVYGSGGATTTAASSPRAASANYQAVDFGLDAGVNDAVNTYMSYANYLMQQQHVNAQNELLKAQADAVKANTLKTIEQTSGFKLSNTLARSTLSYQVGAKQEQFRRLVALNKLAGQQFHLNEQKYDINERRISLQEEAMQLTWQKYMLDKMKYNLSYKNYLLQSDALDRRMDALNRQIRVAEDANNRNQTDWEQFQNLGGKYTTGILPWLKFALKAWQGK